MKSSIFFLALDITSTAIAHSGGTDTSGCHNDHKRGGYHYHKSDDASVTNQKTRNPTSATEKKIEYKTDKIEKNRKQITDVSVRLFINCPR